MAGFKLRQCRISLGGDRDEDFSAPCLGKALASAALAFGVGSVFRFVGHGGPGSDFDTSIISQLLVTSSGKRGKIMAAPSGRCFQFALFDHFLKILEIESIGEVIVEDCLSIRS